MCVGAHTSAGAAIFMQIGGENFQKCQCRCVRKSPFFRQKNIFLDFFLKKCAGPGEKTGGALICVVTTFWGIPHSIVAMVFTAADFFPEFSHIVGLTFFCRELPTHAGSLIVPQIVG